MKKLLTSMLIAVTAVMASDAQRTSVTLTDGWQFARGTADGAPAWQNVRVPHDWAIYGPFDINNDLQDVAVEQNLETEKSLKTGRTGGLPFIGKGVYRRTFNIPDTTGRAFTILFDGAMSNAQVTVNGKKVAAWPYGYNSFYVDRGRIPEGRRRRARHISATVTTVASVSDVGKVYQMPSRPNQCGSSSMSGRKNIT